MIEGENPVGGRFKHDPVRPAANLDPSGLLERLQVKRRDRVVAAVGSEPFIQVGNDGDSMNPGRPCKLAQNLLRFGVQYDDAIGAQNVEPLRRCVGIQVVPTSFASDRDLVDRRRHSRGSLGLDGCRQSKQNSRKGERDFSHRGNSLENEPCGAKW